MGKRSKSSRARFQFLCAQYSHARAFQFLGFVLSGFAIGSVAQGYTVQPHDTLSSLAFEHIGHRVYGPGGTLQKILEWNPQIKNPNFILAGQQIQLNEISISTASKPSPAIPKENVRKTASDESALPLSTPPAIQKRPPPKAEASAAEPVQAAQAEPATITQPSAFSRFQIEGIFNQSRIDSMDLTTNGSSVTGSAFSPEVNGRWEQHWEDGGVTFLGTSLRYENFQTTSTTQNFSSHTPIEFGFEAGGKVLSLGERGYLTASLGYEGSPFVRAKSATELTIDTLSTPKAHLRANFDLRKSRVFLLSTELGASYLAPVNGDAYSTKSGYAWVASLKMTHARAVRPFFGGIKLEQERQDTTISNQTYTLVGIFFGMTFDVPGDKP